MEEYNGWTNRETWAVKLHWDNNQGDVEFFSQNAKEFKESGKSMKEFADWLRNQADDIQHSVLFEEHSSKEAKLFVEDVGSFWRVNWHEIAESYYKEVV